MKEIRGLPSKWLLRNSKGYPDFLFTIVTYSLALLVLVLTIWIIFGILSFAYAGTPKAATLLKIMDSMKTGLVSLAGVVFGLAGSYTVRRYKYDDHHEKRQLRKSGGAAAKLIEKGLKIVQDKEDI